MAYVVGRFFFCDTVWGLARVKDGDGRKILLHQNHRVHPYARPTGVAYTHSVNGRRIKRGLYVRMRIAECRNGLVAVEWMYLDDYERARKKVHDERRKQFRRRKSAKRTALQPVG